MRAHVLLGAIVSGLCLAGCAPAGDETSPDEAEATTVPVKASSPIEVVIDAQGVRLTDWGFDIKQTCADGADPCIPPVAKKLAQHPEWGEEIFASGRMNVLRIPIRADSRGVDEDGNFRPDYYGVIVQAAKNALAVNPKIRIFASRSTVSDCALGTPQCKDFDPSLKEGGTAAGKVLMWKYGRMLGQYLKWFDAQGVHVDILGPDNEPTNNEGNVTSNDEGKVTVQRISATMEALETHYGKPHPKLMLNDGSWPDVRFLEQMDERNAWSWVGFAGTHYQSDERPERHDKLDEFAALARHQGKKEVWDTEYHFTDNKPGDDGKPGVLGEYADAALGVYGIFDQLDAGFSGIVWWAYRPPSEGTSKSEIETALVETIGGAWPLATSDGDGDVAKRGALGTRAVHQGKDVVVWVVNDTDYDYAKMPIALRNKSGDEIEVVAVPAYEQWTRIDPKGGEMSHETGTGSVAKGNAVVAYPPRSITAVRIPGVY